MMMEEEEMTKGEKWKHMGRYGGKCRDREKNLGDGVLKSWIWWIRV